MERRHDTRRSNNEIATLGIRAGCYAECRSASGAPQPMALPTGKACQEHNPNLVNAGGKKVESKWVKVENHPEGESSAKKTKVRTKFTGPRVR